MTLSVRQAHRNTIQRFITDPSVAFIAVFFWGIFKILPVRLASGLGGFCGCLVGRLAYRRNRIALRNLSIAFPKKTQDEHRSILKKMWRHWGRFYAEMPHTKELFKAAEIIGFSYLEKAVQSGKGGFVCSAHFGNWELAASCPVMDGLTFNPVYRPANNPWLDKLMFQRRKGILIPKGPQGARKMLEVLRQKEFVVLLCDQKLREGIDVPFFGKPAKSPSAVATVAIKMQLPVLMAKSVRQPDGHYKMEIFKPLPIPSQFTKENEFNLMCQINQTMEGWIRQNPEQWLWIHRRFDKSEYH